MTTWRHPEIGDFRFDDYGWALTVTLTAFKVFRYREFKKPAGTSQVEMTFPAEQTEQTPSKGAAPSRHGS
jgi:hypothetical protein